MTDTSATIDREEARRREAVFLERFRTAMDGIRELYHVTEEKYYAANSSTLRVVERDGVDVVRRYMDRLNLTDRGVLGEMPADRGVRYEVSTSGFFGRGKVRVVVAAQVLSPVQELLRDGATDARVGAGVAREAFQAIVRDPETFYYVGLASTTGFAEETLLSRPTASNALVVLAEATGATSWRQHLDQPERWKGLANVFDPETGAEKVERCAAALRGLEDLQLRGGHVLLEDAYTELDFPKAVIDQAISALTGPAGEGEYLVKDVGERRILQRNRFTPRDS
jgi:hypothetical protein